MVEKLQKKNQSRIRSKTVYRKINVNEALGQEKRLNGVSAKCGN